MANNEAIQNVADAINRVAEELEVMNNNNRNNRCDFTGYTFADSMGLIANAMTKIAEEMEEANKRK
jgi:uncharacterized protein Yka (UPF0111/DUF47 family)